MPHPCLPLILLVLFLLPGNCWGWALGWGEARRRRALSGSPGGQQREHGWAGQQMMKGKQRQSRWHKAPRARAENQPMEEPSSLRARNWPLRSSLYLLLGIIGLSHAGTEKIFNGTECEPHSQPWQVGLFEGVNLRCGGVLIDRRWVLTAAHCTGRYWVRLGEHSLSRLDWTEQLRRSGFSQTHPRYLGAPQSYDHDIRLLRLGTPARLTRSVQILPLAKECATPGTQCHISGWGTTNRPWSPYPDRLQCLNLSIVSRETCQAVFPGRITENMVCAGGVAGADACQGDSGGPLVCNGVLQGLVSWGSVGPCGQQGIPGVYTNICKYVDWIQTVMRNN